MTKRQLLSSSSASLSSSDSRTSQPRRPIKRAYLVDRPAPPADACAFLQTTDAEGDDAVLWIVPGKNLFVGREPSLWTKTDEGRTLVCVEDQSTNGMTLNGRPLVGRSAILLDGDVVGPRASQAFTLHVLPSSPPPTLPRAIDPSSLASRFTHSLSLSLGAPPSLPSPAPPPPPAQMTPRELSIGKYTVRTDVVLGSGSFGVVRLGWDGRGAQVACKSVVKSRLQSADDLRRLRNEMVLGARARHPNVNRVLGAVDDAAEGVWHIFLELVTGGDLFTYIEGFTLQGRRMGEAECKYLTFQILQGVQYLHGLGVAHRDIKPENILLKHGGSFPTLLICDFGLSTPLPPIPSASSANHRPQTTPEAAAAAAGSVRARSILGTPSYFAPEYVRAKVELDVYGPLGRRRGATAHQQGGQGELLDAAKLDVWGVGVVCWIMMSGTHPFGNQSEGAPEESYSDDEDADNDDGTVSTLERAIMKRSFDRRVLAGEVYPNPALPSYDPSATTFLASLLSSSPDDRPTISQALALEWMTLEPERRLLERVWAIRVGGEGKGRKGSG